MNVSAHSRHGSDGASLRIPWFVIASASEAIQRGGSALDCFVALAPRNDERETPFVPLFIGSN
jgi:hypothetical protein